MLRTSCLLAASSGVALGAQIRGTALALHRDAGEPTSVTGLEEYEPEPLHKGALRTKTSEGCSDEGEGPAKHSSEWYMQRCQEINAHCDFLSNHRLNAARADRQFMKDECLKQKRILADKKDHHADQKADVAAQKAEVVGAKMEVKEASAVVKDHAHCPPELSAAQADLARLEAIPNKSPQDIDAECKAQQRVLEAQKCVDKLRAAEAVLAHKEGEHAEEKSELSHEKTHVAPAAAEVPTQEDKVIEACARWDELEKVPLPPSINGILSTCKAQKDDLLHGLGRDMAALDDECARQKRILSGKKEDHQEEKAEHADQKEDVAATKAQVAQAEATVSEYAHCPPELSAAQADLAKLEAIPNKSPADIDAECEAHQRILEAQKCVDVLREAEAVLAHKESVHSNEKTILGNEAADHSQAKSAVPPQQAKTDAVCADWGAAKAKWEAAMAACKA